MKILALTTATPRCEVALLDGDVIKASTSYVDEMMHAERVFPAIDTVLTQANCSRADLGAVACDVGPGSFTGVRVGLASAKGMALALQIPLLGISGLTAMAAAVFHARPDAAAAACLLDAKRGESFVAVYTRGNELALEPRHVPAEQALSALGDWANKSDCVRCGLPLNALPDARERRIEGEDCERPSASWLARLAAARLAAGDTLPLAQIEPIYVRPPDAIPQGMPGHGKASG